MSDSATTSPPTGWTKKDVIFQDRDRYNVSGAETTHIAGIEASLNWQFSERLVAEGKRQLRPAPLRQRHSIAGVAGQYRRQRH